MMQLENKLEQLIINFSFDDLSEKKQAYVLQYLSREEYESYHLLLSKYHLISCDDEKTLSPSPEIARNLTQKLKNKYKKPFSLADLFQFNNPSLLKYQIIILIGLIALMVYPIKTFVEKPDKIAIENSGKQIINNNKQSLSTNRAVNKKPIVEDAKALSKNAGKEVARIGQRTTENNNINKKQPLCYNIKIPRQKLPAYTAKTHDVNAALPGIDIGIINRDAGLPESFSNSKF